MSTMYIRYPVVGGGNGIATYPNQAALPATAADGAAAITLDTDSLFIFNAGSSTWVLVGGAGAVLSIGALDGQPASANGASISSNALFLQSASATFPGLVNNAAQTFSGIKTFSSAPNLSSLTASLPLQLDASKNVISSAIDLASAQVTNTLPIASGGTNNTTFGTDGILYFNGTSVVTDATNLFYDPVNFKVVINTNIALGGLDAFSRTQIWNHASNAILRLGSLASDGDATTSSSEGIVSYGQNAAGDPMTSTDFGYARIKPMRLGLYNSSTASAFAGYIFKVDPTSLYLADDTGATQFSVQRTTGVINSNSLTASTVLVADASKNIASSSVSTTTLSYLDATSSIQTQLNSKQSTTLTDSHILVGNGSNLASDVSVSGDLSLDNTGAFTIANAPHDCYVDFTSGNDTTGTGTITKPWLTIQHAYNSISPSINAPYVIHVSGGNNDLDTIITAKPNVSIVSDYEIQIRATSFTITGGSTNDSCTFTNVTFVGDFSWVRNDTTVISLGLNNCIFYTTTTFKQAGAGVASVLANNTVFIASEWQLPNSFGFFNNCDFLGATLFDDSGSNTYFELSGGESTGAMTVTGGVAPIYFIGFLHDVNYGASLTFVTTGSGTPNVETDSAGLPPTYTGAANITYLSKAKYEDYTPATSSDWNTVPSLVSTALDDLATSGIYKSQSANLVLASPNGSSGLPTFRALVSADLPAVSPGGISLTNTHVLVGNASNVAADVAMSGDATIANTGALTLATVNGSPGSFGSASQSLSATVNGKGLITSLSAQSIQIAESQVTNLVTDLAGKQPTGNYITALTGDVTASGPGSVAATIANNAVTNAKLAQMAAHTYKGNNTGSTADPIDVTSTQLTADLNLFTSTLQGLTPSSGGGSTNFLRADGTWAAPTGTTITIGALDAQAANANGLALVSNVLSQQSADATHPGLVNNTTQTMSGAKTFSTSVTSPAFISSTATPATAGAVRLANLDFIEWRNSTNTNNVGIQLNASDVFQFGGAINSSATVTGSNLSGTNTGDVTFATFGTTGNANGASLSGQVITLLPATATTPGGVSTTTQSFAGAKTFLLAPAIKDASGSFVVTLYMSSTPSLTTDRQLTIDTADTNSTLKMGANLTVTATATVSGTNTGDITLAAVGSSPNANAATLSGQVLNLEKFSSTQPGVVAASGGGTTNFLRADGTWAAPSGSSTTVPTVQRFTSSSGTYTTPANVKYIRVRMCGGGGAGASSGSGGHGGGTGGNTTFGSSLLTCNGGVGGGDFGPGGAGGTATCNSPAVAVVVLSGGSGQGGESVPANFFTGGIGGSNPFGGAGGTSAGGNSQPGLDAAGQSGGGGGGGSVQGAAPSGGGGGAGGYIEALIGTPSATYAYAVGAAGAPNNTGANSNGGNGGSGVIIVEEFY